MKKLAFLTLALVIVLTMATSVLAADPTGEFAVIQQAADEYLSSGKSPVIKADALFDEPAPGEGYEPRVVAFICTYCTYTAADMAGSMRLQYPANVRVVKLLCTGRVDTRHLLDLWGILHLRNPAATPQYNGSCEAANGSHRKTTNDQAALAGLPKRWTTEDLHRARSIRNRLGRPWGHRGPTPQLVWQTRQPITPIQRSQLNATVNRYRQEERIRRGIPDEAVLGGAAQASVDRVAISRALRQHGYLNVTRRLVTPPIKPRNAARFP